jgi:hypothetical protein
VYVCVCVCVSVLIFYAMWVVITAYTAQWTFRLP